MSNAAKWQVVNEVPIGAALQDTKQPAEQSSDDDIKQFATAKAKELGVDPQLVHSIIKTESNWKPDVVSEKGAKGLMQLMDATAKEVGVVDSMDPRQNITGGVTYLKKLQDKYGDDKDKIIAAYNAGPSAVDQYGGVPPFAETQDYVNKVKGGLGAEQAPPTNKWKVVNEQTLTKPGREQRPLYIGGADKGILGKWQDELLDYADRASSAHYKTEEALTRQASGGKKGYEATPEHLKWLDVVGDPGLYANMGADALGIAQSMREHPVQTVASFVPIARVPVMINVVYQGLKTLDQKRGKDESWPDYIQRILLAGSMVAGAVGALGKQAPADLSTTKQLGRSGINLASKLPDVIDAAKKMWGRDTLISAAHDTLRDSQVGYDKMIVDSMKQARTRVGDQVQDIVSTDKARSPQGYMPSAVIHQVIDSIERAKNAPPSMFPTLEGLRKTLNSYADHFGGSLQWEHLKDLRGEIGAALENASGKDYAAASEAYKAFTNALAARAQQLGKLTDFQEYAKLSKAIDDGSKVYSEFRKAATPLEYWKKLADVSKQPLLRGTSQNPGFLDTLEKFGGMQPKAIEDAVAEHEPLSRLAKQGASGMLRGGRYGAFLRHPAAAVPAGLIAGLMAPGGLLIRFLLSAFAANKAADLVDQFDAARALKPQGAPSLTSYARGQVVAPPAGATPPQAPAGPGLPPRGPGGPQGLPQGQPVTPKPPSAGATTTPPVAQASPSPVSAQAPPQPVVAPQAQASNPPKGSPAPTAPVVGSVEEKTSVSGAPKVSQKAYEAFGISLDPTQWKTPEDVVQGKARAQQQLQVDAVAKGKAIQQALKQGLITKAQADEQLTKLGQDALKAKAAIDKAKAPSVSRGARDRLRKGAKVKERTAAVAGEEQAKERTSGISLQQAVERVADLEKGFKALGEHKEFLRVSREFEKAGGDNYVTLANELEDAYNEVLKKHSGTSPK